MKRNVAGFSATDAIGKDLEYKLLDVLSLWNPDAIFMHDVVIKHSSNDAQIDLIMIDKSGVFVFEAKNYSISICGTYSQRVWDAVGRSRKSVRIENPIDQNITHIRKLRNICIGAGAPVFHNVIVVPDSCIIQTNCREVRRVSELKRYLKTFKSEDIDVNFIEKRLKAVVI